MIDFNKIVADKLEEISKTDFIEKKVESYLKECIDDVIRSSVGRYSEINSTLRKKVEEESRINFDKLDIPQYNKMLFEQIELMIKDRFVELGLEDAKERIEKLMAKTMPKEITLTEIIESFKEDIDPDVYDYDEGYELSLFIVRSSISGFVDIYLDENEVDNKYDCKYHIHLYNNEIASIKIDNEVMDNKMVMGGLYRFKAKLFMMFTSGCNIIIDKENAKDYDLEFSFSEDDDY